MRFGVVFGLGLGGVAGLSEKELTDKVEQARSKWAEIHQHTQSMLEKVHDQMEENIKKLHEDSKRQNDKLALNMKSIEAILAKDAEIKQSIKTSPPSFLEEKVSQIGVKSAAEEEAAARTQALLKRLDDLVKGDSASSFAETTSDDPAIAALKRAQEKMQALQQLLHKQAMNLNNN